MVICILKLLPNDIYIDSDNIQDIGDSFILRWGYPLSDQSPQFSFVLSESLTVVGLVLLYSYSTSNANSFRQHLLISDHKIKRTILFCLFAWI